MRRAICLLAIVTLGLMLTTVSEQVFAQNRSATEVETKRPLSLQDALQRIQSSPALKAATKGVEVKEGVVKQAGLFPNPEIAVEVENFAGKDNLEGRTPQDRTGSS